MKPKTTIVMTEFRLLRKKSILMKRSLAEKATPGQGWGLKVSKI